ncbi:MAG: DUF3347 domain-containing protein [Luteolibacter sp.]
MKTTIPLGYSSSLLAAILATSSTCDAAGEHDSGGKDKDIPAPKAQAAKVLEGYAVEVFLSDLTFPTSIEFDAEGDIYVAESGYTYGDGDATPRIIRYDKSGERKGEITEGLIGPINDLLWHEGKLFISHRGKISVREGDGIKDLVTGLPSNGDHHNNQIVAGPDGKLYFGQGVVTNSGVVGTDNAKMGWLKDHPGLHDVPARDIKLTGETFTTDNPLAADGSESAVTAPFQSFGSGDIEKNIAGETKASGTILRLNPDGTDLEVFAWGLRNPYGLSFAPDGTLFATENGFDVRGSRPIANDKEDLYKIEEGGWYGWPDFASGIPVTDAQFKPEGKPQAKFLMAEHPEVKKTVATYPEHSAIAKMTISDGGAFAEKGKMFIAFFGHMAPMTGTVDKHGGHRVIMVDPGSFEATDFLAQKSHGHSDKEAGESSEEKSDDGNAASAGPRRLLDVQFSPDGSELYVVDFGVMFVDDEGITAKPETGVVWRISKSDEGDDAKVPAARRKETDPKEIQKDEVSVDSGEEVEQMTKKLPDRADIGFKDGMTGKVFHNYLHLRMTLANADTDAAKEAAGNLAESFSDERAELKTTATKIAESDDIGEQRIHFQELTTELEELFTGNLSQGSFYKQKCPMAFGGKGGTWFSDVKEINNPYRDDMKTCGNIVKTYKK